MSLISKLVKAGIAQKAIDQARKPENQEKAKKVFAQVSQKVKDRSGSSKK